MKLDRSTLTGAVEAVQEGDLERYEPLVVSLWPLVRAHVARSGAADGDLDDLVQEAFVQGWKKIRALREPARFRAWLLTIASNLVRDLARRRGREHKMIGEYRNHASPAAVEPAAPETAAAGRLWRPSP